MDATVGDKLATLASELGPAVDPVADLLPSGPLELGIPVTERMLRGLPGPRWLLITLWAGAVLTTPYVVVGAKWIAGSGTAFDGLGELAPQAVLSCVVALLLFGVARLVDHA